MDVTTEKAFVIRLNAEEAGIILALLGNISGPMASKGRFLTESLMTALENAGAAPVSVWCTDTSIEAMDIPKI